MEQELHLTADEIERMTARRRDFHRYPEAGWEEFRTTALVAKALLEAGWDAHFAPEYIRPECVMGRHVDPERERQRALAQGADSGMFEKIGDWTGCYADLVCAPDGPFTALRFDIDCGHDGHAAMGLALAELLARNKEHLKGTIRLLFQSAAEEARGAYAMMRAGLVDGADYFIALHLGLGEPVGTVAASLSGLLSSTKFNVEMTGCGTRCELKITKEGEAVSCESSPELVSLIVEMAASIPGVTAKASMSYSGSDDACWLMRRVQGRGGLAAYLALGAGSGAERHDASLDFDEAAMPIGVETLYRILMSLHS